MSENRNRWNQHIGDSGILRKNEEEEENLFVFGYSCKLFRDDEKARFIDQGKHLIPWMGDESLKIDRYDARGALSDIKPYEAPPGGYDKWFGMTESERQVEQICDQERYKSLFNNDEEEALYHEEELKRFQIAVSGSTYGQVGFNYNDPESTNEENKSEDKGTLDNDADEDDDVEGERKPFIAPPELDIPLNMTVPSTVKENAIIEKTAMFISQQGPQMEIVLKMKQAGNPQFNFLSLESPLNAYYRHLITVIKSGRYRAQTQSHDDSFTAESEDQYLHPSLTSSNPVFDSGKKLTLRRAVPSATATSTTLFCTRYNELVTAQPRNAKSHASKAPMIPSINYKPSADCTYSMLVNKIKSKQSIISDNVYISEESADDNMATQMRVNDGSDYDSYLQKPLSSSVPSSADEDSRGETQRIQSSSLNRKYGSSSESSYSSSSSSDEALTPPHKIRLIIETMANYVVKNGRDFEEVVKSRGDNRFEFLEKNHAYHEYYEDRILDIMEKTKTLTESCEEKPVSEGKNNTHMFQAISTKNSENSDKNEQSGAESDHAKPSSVSFSIKKESDGRVEQRSALPVEESSESESEVNNENSKQTEDSSKKKKKDDSAKPEVLSDLLYRVMASNMEKQKEKRRDENKAKWAVEHAKDKLLVRARERLAAATKEKQLQSERKRKAAEFLSRLRESQESGSPQLCSGYSSLGVKGSSITDSDASEDELDSTIRLEIETRLKSKPSHSSKSSLSSKVRTHKMQSSRTHESRSHHHEHSVPRSSEKHRRKKSRSRDRESNRHRERDRDRDRNRERERERERRSASSSSHLHHSSDKYHRHSKGPSHHHHKKRRREKSLS